MENQVQSPLEAFHELTYYTLAHPDPSFIHQYVVDAFTAQQADEKTKPIALAFALIGLHLHIEKNYSGRDVQKAHMRMAKNKKTWPAFDVPTEKGAVTVFDVLRAEVGKNRDKAIVDWSLSVWNAWSGSHAKVADLVRSELGV